MSEHTVPTCSNPHSMLYPLSFRPRLSRTYWGGETLAFKSRGRAVRHAGRSTDISALKGEMSVTDRGFLRSNTLQEIIEIYMGDLIGDHVLNRFGAALPIRAGFLSTSCRMPVTFCPTPADGSPGRDILISIADCPDEASMLLGLRDGGSSHELSAAASDGSLAGLMNSVPIARGDTVLIPAGTPFALCGDTVAAWVSTSSGYETVLEGDDRNIDFIPAVSSTDPQELFLIHGHNDGFGTEHDCGNGILMSVTDVKGEMERDLLARDSFTLLISLEGEVSVICEEDRVSLGLSCAMIPAECCGLTLSGSSRLLEIWME